MSELKRYSLMLKATAEEYSWMMLQLTKMRENSKSKSSDTRVRFELIQKLLKDRTPVGSWVK